MKKRVLGLTMAMVTAISMPVVVAEVQPLQQLPQRTQLQQLPLRERAKLQLAAIGASTI